jgi:hypothetical protein
MLAVDSRDISNGGVQLVMQAMVSHATNPEIQKIGSAVLADLSLNANNEACILREGGVRLIMRAMKQHAANPSLQETICSVFADLTKKDAILDYIAQEEGVNVIISVLHNFPTNSTIQKCGSASLQNLARNRKYSYNLEVILVGIMRQQILDSGGWRYII